MSKDAIRNRLAELAKRDGGVLTPVAVVDDAKNPESPLHGCFEWDREKAAYAHWIDTARELIRSVKIEVHIESRRITAVAYVRDPDAPATEQGYRPTVEIRGEKDTAARVIEQEFERVSQALHRARELATLFDMRDDIEGMLADVAGLRVKLKAA